jgi:hypothetical protein
VSYREENGQVILALSRDDYQLVLMLLGAGVAGERIVSWKRACELLNRLNEGNPHFTPYATSTQARGQGPGSPAPEERNP